MTNSDTDIEWTYIKDEDGKVISKQTIDYIGNVIKVTFNINESIGFHEETWTLNDELHRAGGPAWFIKTDEGVIIEEWCQNGKRHNEEGYAFRQIEDDGCILEQWYKNGLLHRKKHPAVIRHRTGGSTERWWFKKGELYRSDLDKPVYVHEDEDGTVLDEQYAGEV